MKTKVRGWLAAVLAAVLVVSSVVVGFAVDVSVAGISCLDQLVIVPGGYCYVYPPDYSQNGGTVTLSDAYSYYRAAVGDPSKVILYVFDNIESSATVAQIQVYVFDASSFVASSAVYSGKTYLSMKSSESQLIAFSLPSPENTGWKVGVQTGRQSLFTAPLTTYGVYVAQGTVSLPAWVKIISDIAHFEVLSESDFEAGALHTLTVNYLYTEDNPAADPVLQSLAPGTEYSIPSPEVEGYTPDIPLVAGTMPEEDLTINVYYSRVFYPLTVKYQYSDGNQALEDVVYQYPAGFNYQIPTPELAGYKPDREEIAGEMPTEAVEAVVTYSAIPYTLTVVYRLTDGSQAAESHQEQLTIGTRYYVASPQLEGYRPNQTAVSGVMPASDVTHTVTYRETPGGGGGDDPFGGSDVPPYTGKDPFVIPGLPSYTYDPFIIPGLPPYGYDPFVMPDTLK